MFIMKQKKLLYFLPLLLPIVIDKVVDPIPINIEIMIYLVITLIVGKVYCGFICQLGLLQKIPELLVQKLWQGKYPLRIHGKMDTVARGLKYLFLGLIIVWSVINGASLLTFDHPNGQLEELSQSLAWTSMVIIIGSTFSSLFVNRFFCRYVCPAGAFMGLVNRISFWKLTVDQDTCVHCKMCIKQCPASIRIDTDIKVKNSECYSCLRCIAICPKNAISVKILDKRLPPYWYVCISILLYVVLVSAFEVLKL